MRATFDVVGLSHLRWDFVWQRPQHLMSRCAAERKVLFVEEPVYADGPARTSEDAVVSKVGRELYEKFFRTTRASSGTSIPPSWTRRSPHASLRA